MSIIKEFKLKDYGETLGPRVLGLNIKEDIMNFLKQDTESKAIINFIGVDIISTGFSKELFGGLWNSLGSEFKKRIQLVISENEELIKSAILLGIKAAKEHKYNS